MKKLGLSIESLESRELPSATAGVSQGILRVTGTDQAEVFKLSYIKSTDTLNLSVGNQQFAYRASSISRIEANLGGGNDNWNGLASGFKATQVIHGGSGNDAITTGEGNDTIYGDAGNDNIVPWAGADIAFGGDGNDWIAINSGDGSPFGYPGDVAYGEGGNDTLIGGSNDQLYGGDGNDELTASGIGAYGGTYLNGGNGNDRFFARQGSYRAQDTIIGGAGYDELVTYDLDANRRFFEYLPRDNSIEKID